MTYDEFEKIMIMLADGYDTQIGRDSMQRFWRTLDVFDFATTRHAVRCVIDSGKYLRLPPPAVLRAQCIASQGRNVKRGERDEKEIEMERRVIEAKIGHLEKIADDTPILMTERRWADLQNLRVTLGVRFRSDRVAP